MAYTGTQLLFANNAGSTLAGPITNTATSLAVQSGAGALFPSPTTAQGFVITAIDAATGLLREIMLCTARSTDTFTVVRGQEGTTALNWLAGDLIQELWTAGQAGSMLQTEQLFVSSTTYYVNGTTGNDSNPGTSLLPFLTVQGAVNAIQQFLSFTGVTINVAADTYTPNGGTIAVCTIGASLISSWRIVGSGVSTCNITGASTGNYGFAITNSVVYISGFTIEAYYAGVVSNAGGTVNCVNCNFIGIGSTSTAVFCESGSSISLFDGSSSSTTSTYHISGTFGSVFSSSVGATMDIGYHDANLAATADIVFGTTTVTQTMSASNCGVITLTASYVNFSGSTPTGSKYSTTTAGGINSGGITIPGSTSGTATSPGWYV